MKTLKKLSCVALILVLALCLMTTAFATKIEINNPVTSGTDGMETYNAYKIFDVVIGGEDQTDANAPHAYTIDSSSPFFAAINGAKDIFELTQVGDTTTYTVELVAVNNADTGLAIGNLLGAVENKGTAAATTSQAEGDIYTLDLDAAGAGYYLITSTLGSNMIVDTVGAGQTLRINAKNHYPTMSKTIESIENGTLAAGEMPNTAAYGSVVTFKIDVVIPTSARGKMVVHDVMDSNLTYVGLTDDSFAAAVSDGTETGEDETLCTKEFTISAEQVAANIGETVTIKYTATLNDDAPVDTAIKNTAHLSYSTYETPKYEVEVYTYEFDLVKTKSNNEILTGAKFDLYKVVGEEDVLVESGIEVGTATISGLSNGSYKLVETEAPAGYNKLKEAHAFTIEGASLKATVTVATEEEPAVWTEGGVHVINLTGAELPSTGGIGTTIFYIVGGLLVVGACVLLVTRKRVDG